MTKRVRTSLFHFLASVVAPIVTVVVALAGTQPDNFVSQHPDAAQWVMAALVSLTCVMAMSIGVGVVREQRILRKEMTEALQTVVKTMTNHREDFVALRQHCRDVDRYGIRRAPEEGDKE